MCANHCSFFVNTFPRNQYVDESQQYMEYDSYRYSPKAAQNTPHIYSTPPLSSTMNTNQEPSGYMSVSPVPPASASYADTRQQQQHFQHSPDYNGQRIAYSRQVIVLFFLCLYTTSTYFIITPSNFPFVALSVLYNDVY